MTAGPTYFPIATYTAPSTQTSVTFSAIPSTYTDLVLVIEGAATTAGNFAFQFNGDTGTNYSDTVVYSDGSSAASNRRSNQAYGYFGITYASQGATIANIMNYANTSTYKTSISRSNNASNRLEARVVLWRSTAAINSIKILEGSYASGMIFTLYGITAA